MYVFNNVILARNKQLPDDNRMIETCRSIFKKKFLKSFNIKLSECISWYADWIKCILRLVLQLSYEKFKACLLYCVMKYKCFFFHGATAPNEPGPLHKRGFTITLRHTTVGSTPLEKWSADAVTSTGQHTTPTKDKHPCPQRD